jgi:glycosyltransferase involved in cell wall biosynthesis
VADVPLVSVIVPTYNREELLARSLRSVGQQDYTSLEVVVVDDGGSDDTPAVVERFRGLLGQQGIPVHFVQLAENSGPAVARNRGVEAAEGSLLSFLDSDDLMESAFVSITAKLLEKYPHCTLGFCEAWTIGPDDRKNGRMESGLPHQPSEGALQAPFDRLARHELFQTASVLMRRAAFEQAGGFDETLRYSEDTDLWWRLAKTGDFAYTVEALVCHRYHSDNVSKNEEALVDSIRVHLRHLDDVTDPVARSAFAARIRRRQVLLQETLLRDHRPRDSYLELLEADVGPRPMRYRIGRRIAEGPAWLGRLYMSGIRAVRGSRRLLNPSRADDFSKRS